MVTSIAVNFIAALWWTQDYEGTFMRGAEVTSPYLLVMLEVLGKILMLPLFPLIYARYSPIEFPVIIAFVLNSMTVALLAWAAWFIIVRMIFAHIVIHEN